MTVEAESEGIPSFGASAICLFFIVPPVQTALRESGAGKPPLHTGAFSEFFLREAQKRAGA
jgi:hypothetical protein